MKRKTIYICSNCGYESPKWMGKCLDCGAWNTYQEEVVEVKKTSGGKVVTARKKVAAKRLTEVAASNRDRDVTRIGEVNWG